MRSFTRDRSVTHQRLKPGTIRRIASYARPYRVGLTLFLVVTGLDAAIVVANPLLFRAIIDQGILPKKTAVVVVLAGAVAVLAVADAGLSLAQRWYSARIGESLIYDLRNEVFQHVQRQPIAFFTRTQTGSLVSRLNSDVIGAQQALTGTLASVVSNIIGLVIVLATMCYLSWQVTVVTLMLLPVFILPARRIGRRMQRFTREQMQLDAELGSLMTERFNVAGAMLTKLYGRPKEEAAGFSSRSGRVRDIGVVTAMYGRVFFTALVLVASLATAVIYGLGGSLVINGALQLGTLVALTTLLARLYGPLTALSNVQVDVMTALVSFDRVFEILDLKPMVEDRPGASAVEPGPAPMIDFEHVWFRYPAADEVSLASLESIAIKSGGTRPGTRRRTARRLIPRRAGSAHRARRAVRRGKDHDHSSGVALLRRHLRRRADRRARHPRPDAGLAARRGWRGDAGRAHVPRDDPREPGVRPPGRDRGRSDRGVPRGADLEPDRVAARRPGHRRG